jgi:peptidoglycan hydrolase-like protein with peptidoglycan-binding domain
MSWWEAHRLLRRGSRGPEVEALQRALRQDVAAPTRPMAHGIFDEPTEDAVKAFQRRNALIEDGTVGPITHSLLVTGYYEYAISKPPSIQQPASTCWAAALQSVLHSSWRNNRPSWTINDLVSRYHRFLQQPQQDITVPGWLQIANDLRLRGQQIRGQDLRLEQVVWMLRENRMHLVMVHDMTGAVRHTVVIYGVQIRAGAPNLLVMDPLSGTYTTIGADTLRGHAQQLFISVPGEVRPLPPR